MLFVGFPVSTVPSATPGLFRHPNENGWLAIMLLVDYQTLSRIEDQPNLSGRFDANVTGRNVHLDITVPQEFRMVRSDTFSSEGFPRSLLALQLPPFTAVPHTR